MKSTKKSRRYVLLGVTAALTAITPALQASDSQFAVEVQAKQSLTIRGVVVDSKTGEAVIGANVVVAGTTNGTVTDYEGRFLLEASSNVSLEVSYIGYTNTQMRVVDGRMLTIRLSEDSQQVSEIVVVGYGVQKRESLTGSVQVISDRKLVDVTTPSVGNMLNGKASGVYVNSGSRPGDAAAIVIRGKTTINGSTDPLWVVDGVILGNSPGALNPSDIESLSVLKDAASTAIYGSQGANGVIIVTTQKGKSGKAVVNVDAKLGVNQLNHGNFDVMNGAELYDLYTSFSNQSEIGFPRWNSELRNSNHDWISGGTQLGFAQDYSVSASAGSEDMRMFTSVGLYNEEGAVKGYEYTRYTFRLSGEMKPNKWLTIKPQISGSRTETDDRQHAVGAMYRNLPWDSPYLEDGSLASFNPIQGWVNTTGSNYLYDLQWNFGESTAHEILANMDFDVKLMPWLSFSSVNNYKYNNYHSTGYTDPRSSGGKSVNGRIDDYITSSYRLYTNQILRFNKSFGKHALSALAAYEYNAYYGKANRAISTGFAPGFIVSDVAAVPERVSGSRSEFAVQSAIFNASYAYDSKYLGQVSLRRDGASNFGDNARYGNFFSVSAGWNINREDFFQADWVDQLKVRASYGSVGNRPESYYPQYALYSLSGKYNEIPGAIISQPANPDMSWEKTYTADFGIDMRIFNRVGFHVDYYNKRTSGLLYPVPVPGVTGVTSIWRNVGCVDNNGFEFSVDADLIRNKNLTWSVEANIGFNRNKVTELYGGKAEMIVSDGSGIAGSAQKLLKPGYDADTWYLTEWAGVNRETGAPMWYMTNEDGERVTTSNYGQASRNPVASGSYTPDFFGGFSTNLAYKRFDLAANFTYSVGGEIYNYARAEFDSDGAYTDRNQMNLHKGWSRWEKPGDNATHPLPSYNNKTNSNSASTRFLEDGSYLKLRSLNIGYNLSLPQFHISNLRLFAAGENLFILTKFSGVDPEIAPVNGRVTGVNTFAYPATRKYMFGLRLTL